MIKPAAWHNNLAQPADDSLTARDECRRGETNGDTDMYCFETSLAQQLKQMYVYHKLSIESYNRRKSDGAAVYVLLFPSKKKRTASTTRT